jgi:hypothetical protein
MQKKKNNGEIKACSKACFGHLQVQEKKDSPYPKRRREKSHTKKLSQKFHILAHPDQIA